MTRPLTVFLVAVAVVLLVSLRDKFPRPPLAEAAVLLADGDLDGIERQRMLRITVDGALRSTDSTDLWVGMLAAVALDDADLFARLRSLLGSGELPDSAPPPTQRARLDLGDPVVANVAAAMLAELDGDLDTARTMWRRVNAQCRLSHRPVAASLVAQAHRRLP